MGMSMQVSELPDIKSISDARAEIARSGVRLYTFASLIGVNRSYLSQVLGGRAPLSHSMLLRISAGVREVAQRNATAETERPTAAPVPRVRRLR